jgi:uncharacterized lipoprotein YmbA
MMRMGFFRKTTWMVLFVAVLLVGCRSSTPPVEFYTLNSLSSTQGNANTANTDQKLAIGVGPVQIPQILDRPQIVTRSGPNKLTFNDFHRWAGPLEDDFARVLAENISLLLGTDQVAVYPWETDFKPRYRVALEIRYFEGQWGQDVRLEVIWGVTRQESQATQTVQKSVIKEPLPKTNYEALVAAKSRAIASLSREIVQEIRNLQSGEKSN